jgi:hypothetical protein
VSGIVCALAGLAMVLAFLATISRYSQLRVLKGRLTKRSLLWLRKRRRNRKTVARREYSRKLKLLKAHSKSKTPVDLTGKLMKRSGATLRQKARAMVCHSATEGN